jgi:alkanesulfonate monooxygenase SsuD/methylene tetrahydromethanopterin reductase-like flavin-dependent oxidoreductase (luciferase family)
MRLGIFDHLDDSGRPLGQHYEERLKLAERYDAGPFHAYHLAEHHATPLGTAPSPNLFLACLAQRTRRLRFGPMVYCLPLYHPIRLAEEICMLDQLSGGRLEFGLGRGISPYELSYFGIDTETSREMLREGLELIRKALAGGDLHFEGKHYRVDGMPFTLSPVQRPHPPLWYGIGYAEAAERAAEAAMNVISNQVPGVVRKLLDVYRARWQALGRPEAELPFLGVSRHIVIAEDSAEALTIARRAYRMWRANFVVLWNRHGGFPPGVNLPPEIDDMIAVGQAFVGTPECVAEGLAGLADATTANYLACRFAFGDLSYDETARSLDLFLERVLPALPVG